MKHTLFSKLLSVILSLCVLLCMVPMFGIGASALNATVDSDGTTILISTPEQLAAIGVDANYPRDGAYKLVNDIDLSGFDIDTDAENGNWKPLCANFSNSATYKFEDTVAFCGTFDGQGYTISGMKIVDKVSSVAHLGLFAHVTADAVISNIVFDNCSIDAYVGQTVYAGFVVGFCDKNAKTVNNVAVLNSSISGVSRNASNGSGLGSIAGSGTNLIVNNVYSEAVISGGCEYEGNYQFGIAGIVGGAWRGYTTVNGAVFNGTIANKNLAADYQYANGIFGLNANQSDYATSAGRFTNCWYNGDKLTALDSADAESETIGTNGGHINGGKLTTAELSSKKLSELGLSGEYWCADTDSLALDITLADTNINYPDYILIYDAWDLAKIGKDAAYPLSGKYLIMNDIDMSDYGAWTPIAPYTGSTNIDNLDTATYFFSGVLNGGGHKLSNYSISYSGSRTYSGLFGLVYNGTFCNIIIDNANVSASVSATGYAGSLIGAVRNTDDKTPYKTTVSNVAVYNSSVTINNTQVANITAAGGIVGHTTRGVLFTNCYVDADVTASYVGATGQSAQVLAGGLMGSAYKSYFNAVDCIFAGTVTANNCTSDYTGEVKAAYKRQNALFAGNTQGMSNDSYENLANAKQTNCYYLDTVAVNTANLRGLNGTAISADALKTATADSMGFEGFSWKNDGDGIYLAVAPVSINGEGFIEIDSAEKLAAIGVYSQYPSTACYVLTADIDLSSFGNWTPLCGGLSASKAVAYTGIFDGQGHTISGMTVSGTASNVTGGLFGALTDNNANNRTKICNIAFKDCSVDVSGTKSVDAGIVAGVVDVEDANWVDIHNISIVDCSVNGTASQVNYSGIGSVAGNGTGTQLENIYSDAELSGGCAAANNNFGMGGLVGRAWRGYSWSKYSVFSGTIENTTPVDNTTLYANGIFGCNWNQSSYATDVNGNLNCYYNSDKLTVSDNTNGGEYNGAALSSNDLGITPAGVLGLSSEYWMHNGTTPILKIADESEYVSGDVNADNSVNILDIIRMKKYIASAEDEMVLIAADLKRDQKLTADDLAYMVKVLLGVSNNTVIKLSDASDSVKYLGRARSENNILLMDWSNTGFEFSGIMEGDVTATLTHVTASAATAEDPFTYARVLVSVDGEESIIKVNNGTAVYTLAEDLDFGSHTIKVLKISERTKGRIYGIDVSFLGAIGDRPADKDMVIDFYGDSITAGDGVVKNDRACSADYIEGQYSNLTYAAKAAAILGADMRVAANSGLKTKDAVSKLIDAGNWDYENNQADVVVINLGTNDKWVIWDDNNPETTETAAQDYGIAVEKAAIEAMLDATVAKYPNAKIVWVYGMMGNGLADYIQPVVEAYAQNNANVYYCELPANTFGGGNHPNDAGHAAAGAVLAEFIEGITAE